MSDLDFVKGQMYAYNQVLKQTRYYSPYELVKDIKSQLKYLREWKKTYGGNHVRKDVV